MVAFDQVQIAIRRVCNHFSWCVGQGYSILLELRAKLGNLEDPECIISKAVSTTLNNGHYLKTLPEIPIRPSGHSSAEKLHA
jgi:hypothetical protein